MEPADQVPEERLVKSSERVRDLGEVFTPRQMVDDMLDLLPKKMWNVDPSPTFLEPACGDGNFLVAILERKLAAARTAWEKAKAPAGTDDDAFRFHALQALSSIYGVDISEDNIVGGVPEHPIGARTRMLVIFTEFVAEATGKSLRADSKVLRSAEWIMEKNIQVGNMLAFHADGSPSYREDLPLMAYEWVPDGKRVSISATTLGDVMTEAQQHTTDTLSLFGAAEPTSVWSGPYDGVHQAANASPASNSLNQVVGF